MDYKVITNPAAHLAYRVDPREVVVTQASLLYICGLGHHTLWAAQTGDQLLMARIAPDSNITELEEIIGDKLGHFIKRIQIIYGYTDVYPAHKHAQQSLCLAEQFAASYRQAKLCKYPVMPDNFARPITIVISKHGQISTGYGSPFLICETAYTATNPYKKIAGFAPA